MYTYALHKHPSKNNCAIRSCYVFFNHTSISPVNCYLHETRHRLLVRYQYLLNRSVLTLPSLSPLDTAFMSLCDAGKHPRNHRDRQYEQFFFFYLVLFTDPCRLNGPEPLNQKHLKTNFPLAARRTKEFHLYHVSLQCLDFCQDYSAGSDCGAFLRQSCAVVARREGDREVMLGWVEFVFICMYVPRVTFTQQFLQRRVYGSVTLASVLSCQGNYSRCGLLWSKEERGDDLYCFRGKRGSLKRDRERREREGVGNKTKYYNKIYISPFCFKRLFIVFIWFGRGYFWRFVKLNP